MGRRGGASRDLHVGISTTSTTSTSSTLSTRDKLSFKINTVTQRIRRAVRPFPKAAMFALAEEGYGSVFQQLVACVLSIRTLDEVSLPAARALFQAAATPKAIARMNIRAIDRLIRACAFHEAKAAQIRDIARRTDTEFAGELPCDAELLRSFRGVGPKCAHLALGVACGASVISVDVHVHRVTNRWGYVATATPEATMLALERKLPPALRVEINALLVPFGKHICTGRLPHCSTCPVLEYCRQVGVTAHR